MPVAVKIALLIGKDRDPGLVSSGDRANFVFPCRLSPLCRNIALFVQLPLKLIVLLAQLLLETGKVHGFGLFSLLPPLLNQPLGPASDAAKNAISERIHCITSRDCGPCAWFMAACPLALKSSGMSGSTSFCKPTGSMVPSSIPLPMKCCTASV